MTNTESRIKEMRDAGYNINIRHFRPLKSNGMLEMTYNNSRSRKKYGKKPEYLPCGGMTVALFNEDPDETFIAECSKKDNFCFKDGTYIAVYRAYTYFKKHLVEKKQGAAIQQEVPESKSCCCGNCCSGKEESTNNHDLPKTGEKYTKYAIICRDPRTKEFVGFVEKDDEIIKDQSLWNLKPLSPFHMEEEYTKNPDDVAWFSTYEDANKCIRTVTESVISVTTEWKILGT